MSTPELSNHRAVRLLSTTTGTLVAFLAAGAFALSFNSLQHLASEHGVSVGLTWIWPLILDGAIIVFSLSVLRSSLYRESTRYPMFLVVCATFASLVFNIAHAPEGAVAKLMASVPPLALFASFELVVRHIRSEVKRFSIMSSLEELSSQLTQLSGERDNLSAHVDRLIVHRQTLKTEIRQAKSPSVQDILDKANEAREDKIRTRLRLVADMAGQGRQPSEIANAAGVSVKTIKRDLERLRAA